MEVGGKSFISSWVYVGTSGYSFKEWVGSFYPPKTPSNGYLRFYASRLMSVEINHTFRRFPRTSVAAAWAAETPEAFRFSFKMHQSITHISRLKGIGSSVEDFLRALEPLGPRLGVLLFQLPPSFPANPGLLEEVLNDLPRDKKFAFEFRHPSWNDPHILDLLQKAGVALCNAELEIRDKIPSITAPHAYIRVRKEPPYSEEEMGNLEGKIKEGLKQTKELYVYIKHDKEGLAPGVALHLKNLF